MKKFLVILAAFSFSAASAQSVPAKAAHGQHHRGEHANLTPEQRADRSAQRLTQKLNLSATQTQQVRQLHLSRAQAMQTHKAQAGTAVAKADKKQHHAAMKAGKAQYDAQLKQILSADQYAKYTQLQADKMAKRKNHQGQGRQEVKQGKS
ncbi:DUF4890 domain-containing protein [Hymenobacter rubripertinctus]|uniref:DUF4890 domain-containing protein n=1 Tax=Hymenobacter rubripertinctus TaxID=2029981 RepID=A0A418QWC2_9BACT|nr:DUF4890 domain-containing protein [Hymenobacter rubripertinctus]RIY09270.1 DUF4890 domain-containing protein [Hymenobacter rubripertinctus]